MAVIWSDIARTLSGVGPLLATVAPTLATAVGGPLAGTAVTFLERALGLAEGGGAEPVAAALAAATPDQLAALKRADNDFAVQMRQLDIAVEKLDYDDRASARERQAAIKDAAPEWMGSFILVAFVAATAAVLLGYAHVESALAGTLIGYLSAKAEQVLAYFFGSTSSSKAKDVLLFNSTPAAGK